MSSTDPHDLAILREMRKLGIARPSDVSEEQWDKAKPSPLDSPEPQSALRTVLESPELQAQMGMPVTDKQRLALLYGKATETLLEILESKTATAAVKFSAAQYIIDHMIGKPKQDVNHNVSVLHQFITRLDEAKKSSSFIDVSPKLDRPKDAVETFVEGYVPNEEFSVGKRGASDGESAG